LFEGEATLFAQSLEGPLLSRLNNWQKPGSRQV
jgi:hypothetical protein